MEVAKTIFQKWNNMMFECLTDMKDILCLLLVLENERCKEEYYLIGDSFHYTLLAQNCYDLVLLFHTSVFVKLLGVGVRGEEIYGLDKVSCIYFPNTLLTVIVLTKVQEIDMKIFLILRFGLFPAINL